MRALALDWAKAPASRKAPPLTGRPPIYVDLADHQVRVGELLVLDRIGNRRGDDLADRLSGCLWA